MIVLERRVHAALDWAESALTLAADPPADLDLSRLEAPAEKIVAEVAIFLRDVAECPDRGLRLRALSLARQVEALARNPKVAAALALRPAVARDVSVGHVLLGAMGFADADYAACLARSIASPLSASRERLPHRELEQDWLSALAEGGLLRSSAINRTALCRGLDLLGASRDDLYALTHAVAYATDFGRWTLPPEVSLPGVLSIADSALANVLDVDDFDLAAELVLAWPCMGVPLSAQAVFALTVMARVEDEAGILPSFGVQRQAVLEQPESIRRHYLTAVSYHTVLVMGLACSALMRCGAGEGDHHSHDRGLLAYSRRYLADLQLQDRRPAWMADAEGLPQSRLAALAPFLLDVALLRALRTLDFAALRMHLSNALQAGITLTPLALQTAQMLSRLAASSGALGLSRP